MCSSYEDDKKSRDFIFVFCSLRVLIVEHMCCSCKYVYAANVQTWTIHQLARVPIGKTIIYDLIEIC